MKQGVLAEPGVKWWNSGQWGLPCTQLFTARGMPEMLPKMGIACTLVSCDGWCPHTQRYLQTHPTQVLNFVKEYVPEGNTAQLAGNSVHVDRMFLVSGCWGL